jgi:aspartyl protease family protein
MPLSALLRRDNLDLLPSVLLAAMLTAAAGLPGFVSLSEMQEASPLRLYSMTELTAGQGGHFFTKAHINNNGIQVVVDTGASVVALSWKDAEKAGLKPSSLNFDIPVSTANGTGKAARVLLESVEIDNVRVYNVQGMVLQKGALDVTLLGMSFLGRLQSFSVENGKLLLKN